MKTLTADIAEGADGAKAMVTPRQLEILQHSLGVDRYGRGKQYRNRFVTDADCPDGQICAELVQLGLMTDHGAQSIAAGMHCFTVTEAGLDVVSRQSPEPPKVSPGQRRYQEFQSADSGMTFGEWLHRKPKYQRSYLP